jgi:hypothetical protein
MDLDVRFLQWMWIRTSFLPNLMVLHWDRDNPSIYLQQLLRPTLVSLSAYLAEPDGAPALLSLFDNYPLLCRSLKSVRFRFPARGPRTKNTIHALSRAICNNKTLEEVVLDVPIDDIALRHLSTLPTLKALTVNLSEISRPRTCPFLPTDSLFCSAEELAFRTSDLDLVTSLLRPCDQIFHSLRVHHHSRLTSDAIIALFNALTPRSRTKPLQDLALSNGDGSYPMFADQTPMRCRLSYETLQPLMAHGLLRRLTVECTSNEQISLDDDEIANLARSWPMLEFFYVYCGRGYPSSTKYPTLRGLLSLAHSCPELDCVSLPLDARQVPVVDEAEVCETSFEFLDVQESPINDARPVAEFLLKYLPCVRGVYARSSGYSHWQNTAYGHWEAVQRHLEQSHGSSDTQAVELAI